MDSPPLSPKEANYFNMMLPEKMFDNRPCCSAYLIINFSASCEPYYYEYTAKLSLESPITTSVDLVSSPELELLV